ncbi:MAG TPA: hypothetical protein VG013_09170 [Gemmataceae bacterium]|nr:hypothetical protein [Gemmataceae bacterium]
MHSRAFPQVTPADVTGFPALRGQMDENAIVRQFRAWVRQQLAARRGTSVADWQQHAEPGTS